MIGITEEHVEKTILLGQSIDSIVERIVEFNTNLQDLTKEFLGESYSEDIMNRIIKDELHKELMGKLGGIFFGE